jgi:hypothetical protein
MQNRLNVRQKGHDGSQKKTCRESGKKYHFQKGGGGINIIFGPKYRTLVALGRAIYPVVFCEGPSGED